MVLRESRGRLGRQSLRGDLKVGPLHPFVKILFVTSHFGFLRNFEFAIRALAARGHEFRLVADRRDSLDGARTIDGLRADFPRTISEVAGPKIKDTTWQPLGSALRLTLDYWRYLHPRYADSPKLKARAASQAPPLASTLGRMPVLGSRVGLQAMGRVMRSLERSLPISPPVVEFLRTERPDLLLVTPLLYFGSQQGDYIRAARQLGIRSVLCVGSWDHLTTKGLIHEVADRVIVWNEAQRQEAAEIHGIPASRVSVTGAQAYDHWFVTRPTLSREAFCAKVGLRLDRPFLLYLCSSPFITPHEVGFVDRWIGGMRASTHAALRDAGILVRPHPQNAEQWTDATVSRFGNVAVYPRGGANPVDSDARAEYFDSMHHSAAVVGVNTSGLIESGIVGRMVYTVLDAEFASTQEGTLHFRHLQRVNGGLLHVAQSMAEHYAQLTEVLTGQTTFDDKARRFVETFIRPGGVDVPAAQIFADVIEAEGRLAPPAPVRSSALVPAWHAVLTPIALAAQAAAKQRREEVRRQKAEQVFRDKDPAAGEAR